jgi:tRNA threonylcarbamoyladenosine biosynthesis protein TsaE
MNVVTKNASETKKVARQFAAHVRKALVYRSAPRALIVSLEGNLGAGKTTFTQAFARALGVRERITSPTFVVLKRYAFPVRKKIGAENYWFYHIDCYRFKNFRELAQLEFTTIAKDPRALVFVEWGERVRRALPAHTLRIGFKHAGGDKRGITIPELPEKG